MMQSFYLPNYHHKIEFRHFFSQIFSQFLQHFVENQQQLNQIWFQQTFLYCLAWAFGASLLSKH